MTSNITTGLSQPEDFKQERMVRRLDEIIKILRRLDRRLASEPITEDLKDLVFDEAAPNGRLI